MKIVEIGVNGMFYAMSGQNFIAKSLFLPYNIGRIISKCILRRFRRPAAELKRGGQHMLQQGGFLYMLIIGSHVGMSGKDMLKGSVKEALSYGANTFMVYTGAPQNTRRKEIDQLNIPAARELMKEHDMNNFIVHAPYIINLANTVKPETFELATEFLAKEITRTAAMGTGTASGLSCRCR